MVANLGLPILDISKATKTDQKLELLDQLHNALFNLLPTLFDQPPHTKASLPKLKSPHFLGYSGYAEETTLGVKDLREQFDLATELLVIHDASAHFAENGVMYHDALQKLPYRFVHLVEEAFGIPVGTFDAFFPRHAGMHLCPQHHNIHGQGVGAYKDSSGWLTLLYQVGIEGHEVLDTTSARIAGPSIIDTLVVKFGNAFEAATEGAVKATTHLVRTPSSTSNPLYSIPFFQGLPLDLSVFEIRTYIPRRDVHADNSVSSFLDF
ncbi:Clavaminate synthase-like protein [Dothidotthia symphoricarpi CBS 119687]|uniref:Clavaminate synthase-like protein n=1 Tax=Dothidotthia symphoricarpi CBS 119687 TaxID=1392245 RepID=A0A6A6A5W6_9PLEO|nr:Clavaminate synthase-like protein [Dothidotthia symphoricarpi CBS 119687]KAF2126001.1 Clavaminate synthase-like protein [Dothidotthia symphoricarpi CBS 119687]